MFFLYGFLFAGIEKTFFFFLAVMFFATGTTAALYAGTVWLLRKRGLVNIGDRI
jgi:hypothetical protein